MSYKHETLKIATILSAAMLGAHAFTAVADPAIPSFREYLAGSAIKRSTIDILVEGKGWAKFDPELGYVLNNSVQPDGIDGSSTLITTQPSGARTSHMYSHMRPRINTYGDSFTQGSQVSDGETWQEYLAAHLREPIGNFGVGGYGVYQAYRRMVREETTDHGAKYVILYIWGDDSIRSLFRSRWASHYPLPAFKNHMNNPLRFHGNFWSNVEMDLRSGRFVEKQQILPTKASLYKMTESQWMTQNLSDDLAAQLLLYSQGFIRDLHREKINRLAASLDFSFDWELMSDTDPMSQTPSIGAPMSPMQTQAAALLDRYSTRATIFILAKAQEFVEQHQKELLVVLFDPYRVIYQMRDNRPRYDQEIVDYLIRERMSFFDMNEVHLRDFEKYDISWPEYLKLHMAGHYKPSGNHFFAYSIKDRIVEWLHPKPAPYQSYAERSDMVRKR